MFRRVVRLRAPSGCLSCRVHNRDKSSTSQQLKTSIEGIELSGKQSIPSSSDQSESSWEKSREKPNGPCILETQTLSQKIAATKAGSTIDLCGWLVKLRRGKRHSFAVLCDGLNGDKSVESPQSADDGGAQSLGTQLQLVNVVLDREHLGEDKIAALSVGTGVRIKGTVAQAPRNHQLEVHADDVIVDGPVENRDTYPLAYQAKMGPNNDPGKPIPFIPLLRTRQEPLQTYQRIRSTAQSLLITQLTNAGFIWTPTPVLTGHDCEGGGETFSLERKDACDFFGAPAYLSVSGQLHLECAVMGMSRVFTLGPAFRVSCTCMVDH